VGGHVVRSFRSVFENRISVFYEARQPAVEVGLNVRIRIFLHEQAGGSVLNEESKQSVHGSRFLFKPPRDFAFTRMQAAARSPNIDASVDLPHKN
jgi:hypothetical protein